MSQIKIKAIQPMFNALVTTMDKYEDKGGLILDSKVISGAVKEYQTVVAVGDSCKGGLKVGDLVKCNFRRYLVPVQKSLGVNTEDNVEKFEAQARYKFDTIEMNGRKFLKLFDNDIDFIVTDYDEVNDVIVPDTSLQIGAKKVLL